MTTTHPLRPRCDWCGEPIRRDEPVTELYARADAGEGTATTGMAGRPETREWAVAGSRAVADERAHATICPDCYAGALSERGFNPVAVERVGGRRLVLLREAAQVGPVDCRYAAAPDGGRWFHSPV